MYFTLASLAKCMGSIYRKIERWQVGFPLNVFVAIDIGHSSRLLEITCHNSFTFPFLDFCVAFTLQLE